MSRPVKKTCPVCGRTFLDDSRSNNRKFCDECRKLSAPNRLKAKKPGVVVLSGKPKQAPCPYCDPKRPRPLISADDTEICEDGYEIDVALDFDDGYPRLLLKQFSTWTGCDVDYCPHCGRYLVDEVG